MPGSFAAFLDLLARRGSWVGGGSVAATSAALAAALLEKLVTRRATAQRLRRIRGECLELVRRDSVMFAKVIQATRRGDRRTFGRALKAATAVPCRVFQLAQVIQATCRSAQRSVNPRFQSDLRCALAVALAASESARTLIDTNLEWLQDARYATQTRRRMRSAGQRKRPPR